jgi:gas vesicle protein
MRKTAFLLIGVLSGAVVGAAAALLLTPYSGKELQGQIRTRLQDLVEQGKQAASARRAELQAQLEALKRGAPAAPAE